MVITTNPEELLKRQQIPVAQVSGVPITQTVTQGMMGSSQVQQSKPGGVAQNAEVLQATQMSTQLPTLPTQVPPQAPAEKTEKLASSSPMLSARPAMAGQHTIDDYRPPVMTPSTNIPS
jgi:hypothetical protein